MIDLTSDATLAPICASPPVHPPYAEMVAADLWIPPWLHVHVPERLIGGILKRKRDA